jgi:hypothetical protein
MDLDRGINDFTTYIVELHMTFTIAVANSNENLCASASLRLCVIFLWVTKDKRGVRR